MTVARADDRAPLATGPERVSEGTLSPLLSHSVVKSEHSVIGQTGFAQEIVRPTHHQGFAVRQ